MSTSPAPLDRRRRRHLETIEEVLDIAAVIMAEQGVAGLSIGEVARRMGIRPPSLYVYFPSKHALYDGLFARGARQLLAVIDQVVATALPAATSLDGFLLDLGQALVRWAVEHPAYSQLLFWRPVPGYAPSPEAYEPAVRLLEGSHEWAAELQRRGLLRPDVPVESVARDWTVIIAGVVSQQLSNAPDEDFASGRFTTALPGLVAMFARHYAPPEPATDARAHLPADPPASQRRSTRRADQRRPDR